MSIRVPAHPFFYQIKIASVKRIDELVKDKFPWGALRRFGTSPEEFMIAFWAIYETNDPLPEAKSYLLRSIAYYLGLKAQVIVEDAGRDWPVRDELTASQPITQPTRGEAYMATKKPAAAAATATATKKPVTTVDAKVAQAAAAADEASTPKERGGKAPGGVTWVEWFKKGHAAGKEPNAMRDEYVEIRKAEYEGRHDILKRHAYRHLRLALPDVTLPKEAAAAG
jgi:hypothetical protein